MHAGPPDDGFSDELTERLSRLVSTVDDAGRAQLDRGRALVNALTDQLAAGQSETLYGLQTAARTVRDRAAELQRLANELPAEIGDQVRALVQELADAAGEQIRETVSAATEQASASMTRATEQAREGLESASTKLGVVLESVQRDLGKHQEDYLSVLRDSARATGSQLSTELEHAATTVVESAARAKASQTAVRAAAVAAVEALESASGSFAEDAEAIISAMTAVGESFIGRLFEVLDERDAREQQLDELLSTRVEQLTHHAEKRLRAITAAVEAQLGRLEQRDLTERTSTAAELTALVDRLLNEPRGRLKDLRGSLKSPPVVVPANPEPLRAEPAYQREVSEPEPPPRKAAAKRAPAKKATASKAVTKKAPTKKAPTKKAPAKKSPAKKTATKNEDT